MNYRQLETNLRAKLTNHLVSFVDAYGGFIFGFTSEVRVNNGTSGEPEVLLTINDVPYKVTYSFLTKTLEVY